MNSKRPPGMATWLLMHLGCSPNNNAVLGDLMERWSQGKSSIWYWRQVATAISAGFVRQMKDHPRPIFRGIAMGWTVYAVWLFWSPVLFRESSYPRWIILSPYFGMAVMIALLTVVLLVHVGMGWIVSWTSAEYRRTTVLGYAATTLMYGVAQFGWQRYQFWRTYPDIPGTLFVSDIVVLGSFAAVFATASLLATLFGGGLLSASLRR